LGDLAIENIALLDGFTVVSAEWQRKAVQYDSDGDTMFLDADADIDASAKTRATPTKANLNLTEAIINVSYW
jgi:hypothetical protein